MSEVIPGKVEYAPDIEHISMPVAEWRRLMAAAYYRGYAAAERDHAISAGNAAAIADWLAGES